MGSTVDAAATAQPDAADAASGIRQAGEVRSRRVESLRAVAALLVLFSHCFDFTHLDLVHANRVYNSIGGHLAIAASWGVYLFFALTGYLIFLPFARRWWGERVPVDHTRYAANRALRILPIYYAVLFAFLALHRDHGSWSAWWRFVLFLQNYDVHTIYTVDGPMWSLVDEVQFYVLLPILALVLAVVTQRSRRAAVAALLLLGSASALARLIFWVSTSDTSKLVEFHVQSWYLWITSLPLTVAFFVPGMLLALVRISWTPDRLKRLRGPAARRDVWFGLGVVILLVAAASARLQTGNIIVLPAAFLVVGACVLPLEGGGILRALDWRPLAAIGVASYSLYLVHQPVVEALATAEWMPSGFWPVFGVALVSCLALAAAGYLLVERPFLKLRRGWSPARAAS